MVMLLPLTEHCCQVVRWLDAPCNARRAVIGGHHDRRRVAHAEALVRVENHAEVVVGIAQRGFSLSGAVAARVAGVIRIGVPEHQQRRHDLG